MIFFKRHAKIPAMIKVSAFRKISWRFRRKTAYDTIFALGSACHTAEAMKFAGLRSFSSPFDWVWGGSAQDRADVLAGGFEHFFDKKDFRALPDGVNHENTRTKMIYRHDFPKNFDADFRSAKEKHERRAKRLLDKIHAGRRTLAVYAEWGIGKKGPPTSIQQIKELSKRLDEAFGGKVDLLYIRAVPDRKHRFLQNDGHLIIADFLGGSVILSKDIIPIIDILSFFKLKDQVPEEPNMPEPREVLSNSSSPATGSKSTW